MTLSFIAEMPYYLTSDGEISWKKMKDILREYIFLLTHPETITAPTAIALRNKQTTHQMNC